MDEEESAVYANHCLFNDYDVRVILPIRKLSLLQKRPFEYESRFGYSSQI
jgi:hypothetical protein